MKSMGQYDGSLGMFVETDRAFDLSAIRFMRWLAERGLLEHEVAGEPTGALTTILSIQEENKR